MSVTPDASQVFSSAEPAAAPTAAQMSAAATSRRARRLAASGAPVVQPMSEPVAVIAEPASQSVTDPVVMTRPEPVVMTEPATITTPVTTAPATESIFTGHPDHDAFAVASEAFGFAAVDDEDEAPEVPLAAEPVTEGAAPEPIQHVAPARRNRVLRRVVATGASVGVMGVAGLIAVSMTLPVSAVAASQGKVAAAATSLVAEGDETSPKVTDGEIQAYVASADVQDEVLQRSESFETVSLTEVAAEEGIHFSESLYTNDPDAAIQWPFIVGVAMSSPYGQRWGRLHAGIDLVPGNGAPIQAIADGVVRTATEAGGAYGVTVYIDHVIDGQVVTSHYAHMQHGSLQVQAGQQVKVGDIIGKVGNTGRSYGAHLHFEIIINGSTVDPLPWMRENAGRYEY